MKREHEDKKLSKLKRLSGDDAETVLSGLFEEKNLLKLVLNAMHEGVLVARGGGEILFVNEAAKTLLDFNLRTGRATRTHRIQDVIRNRKVQSQIMQFLKRTNASDNTEIELSGKPPRWLSLSGFWVETTVDEDEQLAVVSVRDITQDRLLESQRHISAQNTAMRTLAMGLAHEIKNPLNSMKLHAQVLKREIERDATDQHPLDMQRVSTIADVMLEEIERLGHVITEFGSAVRPTNPMIQETNISTLAERACRLLMPEADEAQIALRHNLDFDIPPIPIDPNQISMAIVNLIKNAFEAFEQSDSEKEKIVTLTTSADDTALVIEVADNGCGMSPETVQKIFEPYYTTKALGTGLGLAIVARIVREHAGHIAVRSAENTGTHITLRIPLWTKPMRLLATGE